MELLATIFEICIIPLLGVLTAYAVKWIKAKSNEMQVNVDNSLHDKYIKMLEDTITTCVLATNQTYTESLKQQGEFDKEAQKKAFEETAKAVMSILTEDAQQYLSSAVGDLNIYITQKIEANVNINKGKKTEE